MALFKITKSKILKLLFIIITSCILVFCLNTTGFKYQIKIIPDELHGRKLYSNLSHVSSFLNIKSANWPPKPYYYIKSHLKSKPFIKQFILEELNDWENLFYTTKSIDKSRHDKLNKLISDFQNKYFHLYQKPKNGLIIIEINVSDRPYLNATIAEKLYAYLENKISLEYKSNIRDQIIHLEKTKNELTLEIKELEKFYTEIKIANKYPNDVKTKILLERLELQLDTYNSVFNDIKKRLSLSKLELLSDQKKFILLEKELIPVKTVYPNRLSLLLLSILLLFFIFLFFLIKREYKIS